MNHTRRTFFKQKVSFFVTLLIIFIAKLEVYSQVSFFPTEAKYFIPDNTDSVLIFTKNLAVTASGENLERLQLKNDEIYGEDIPPTLKLRNPIGALLYHRSHIYKVIPVIIGRKDCQIPYDKLVREYFLPFSNFKGHSAKGGIKINVWQKDSLRKSFLIFLNNGQVVGSDDENWFNIPTKNLSLFEITQLPGIESDIAGVWIYPPEVGLNQITAEILRLMQKGPLLVEYWDGLGWQFFEQAFLSQVIENIPDNIRMAFSLFPPETATNYSAMVSGGLPEITDKQNLFIALNSRGIEYQVLEGEKLIFPIPGNVKMHTVSSPEQKDAEIFHSALSIVKKYCPPLLLLHYHGLDDLNHSLGPYDPGTVKHFQRLWDWHYELRKHWQGNMLIVSDHGSHAIKKNDHNITIKDTRGTHGEFIFSDMAVPIIVQAGLGKKKINSKLTNELAEQIWNKLGTPISLKDEKIEDQPGELKIVNSDQIKLFSIEKDADLFSTEFYFNYLKKGKPLKGYFKGIRLIDLLTGIEITSVKHVIAFSFDGHQVTYSNDDLVHNDLVLGLELDYENHIEAFTLYPLKDKFPNRMVKQLKRIEVF